MTQITPREKFVFTFARDEKGQDMKYRFMLTLSRRLGEKIGDEFIAQRLNAALTTLDGVDAVNVSNSRYSVEIILARTFDPDEIIEEIKKRLTNDILSDIYVPKLIS